MIALPVIDCQILIVKLPIFRTAINKNAEINTTTDRFITLNLRDKIEQVWREKQFCRFFSKHEDFRSDFL